VLAAALFEAVSGTAGAAASTTTTVTTSTGPVLRYGARGPVVRTLQQRLATLRYWVGPVDGVFGDATQQAVYALQKAARLAPDGVVGPATWRALGRGVRAPFRPVAGAAVEIDLGRDLLLLVRGHALLEAFNTSTGGGYAYSQGGMSGVASTPRGRFTIYRQVDGLDVSPLGELWRPKYFVGGVAIHGSWSVPPTPVSHGCVRLSIEAMDWVWATNQMPVGRLVLVY
jgi:hypothetical protein